jgi:acyl carrier protein
MKGKPEIRAFVQDLLVSKGDSQVFDDSDSLLFSGRLQSIDAVEIVVFLEENFAVDFAVIGFDQEQIDSINAIEALIKTTSADCD